MDIKIIEKYFNSLEIIEDIKYQLSIMHPEDLEFVSGIIAPLGVLEEEIWKQQLQSKNLDTMRK